MNIQIGYTKSKKNISNVSIASAITSKARIKLYKGFLEIIKENGRLLYCDTDSIIASFNKNKEIENRYLGNSEVIFNTNKEDTEITDAVFSMPKTYGLKFKNNKSIVKIKGFNNIPNFDEFKEAFYNNKEIKTINNQ
jgi:hypothetical protein